MESMLWTRLTDGRLRCGLCAHACVLSPGQRGRCGVRCNHEGQPLSLVDGLVTGVQADPVEKKPLYHFLPGSRTFSVGSAGCNFSCRFCQNHHISRDPLEQERIRGHEATPEMLVEAALRTACRSLAFTYNEPLVGYEFVYDTARLLKEVGLATVLVTNGQIEKDSWLHLLPYIDAVNIDLKGFTQSFYDWIGGDLKTTKAAIEMAAEDGVHVEVTTLVIPGKNDSAAEMAAEAEWLAGISAELPLHLSRYFPRYQSRIPMTPVETLQNLRHVAEVRLRFVHLGNI